MKKLINKIRDWLTEHETFTFYLIFAVVNGLLWCVFCFEVAVLFAIAEVHYDLVKGEKIDK